MKLYEIPRLILIVILIVLALLAAGYGMWDMASTLVGFAILSYLGVIENKRQ